MKSETRFEDVLRAARSSRAAVVHEFLSQYDPRGRRVHAFFEGHDDEIFHTQFLRPRLPAGYRLTPYRCDGKSKVYAAFEEITRLRPSAKLVLFFVDKDVDDLVGAAWPTDPRIFVTDVYSVENYLVTRQVFERHISTAIRVVGVTFEREAILSHFDRELAEFRKAILPVMAWAIACRRAGRKFQLKTIRVERLVRFTDDCRVRRERGRFAQLEKMTQVTTGNQTRALRPQLLELSKLEPQRVIRGKWEAWFVVRFFGDLVQRLSAVAKEAGGRIEIKVLPVTEGSVVATLVPHLDIPHGLERFLDTHLPNSEPSNPMVERRRPRWWRTLWARFVN
jgi:hypothetical protein